MSSANRRDFLKTAGAVAAGATAPYLFTTSRALAAEGRPILGCIGTGDRWDAVGPQAMNFADCVAVCDVDANHAEKGAATVKGHKGQKGHTPEIFGDYRKLLERKDIEVVTIVTPDHWHSKIAIEAMQAGKDVYCEKPLTLTIDEGKQIIKVLKETKRVFQVGTQQRSEMSANKGQVQHQFLVAVALCHAGKLGKLKKVTCVIGGAPASPKLPKVDAPKQLNWEMWLGQAPMTDYVSAPSGGKYPHSRTHYEFRWWYEYSGGKMTDWGAHHVDIASWAIGATENGPLKITPDMSKTKFPVTFAKGMPAESDRYNTATDFLVHCQFPGDVLMEICHDGENGITIEGEKGTLFVSRGALRCDKEDVMANLPSAAELSKLYKGKQPGNHMGNFFECIKTREDPISDVYTHHRAMTTCHLANIAIRLGREIKWDSTQEQVVGDDEANSFLKREQRKGYEIKV